MTKNTTLALRYLSLSTVVFAVAFTNGPKKTYSGIKRSNLDTTVSPASDFYQFANGGWLKNNPIPETESRWGSFNELAESNNNALKKVLQSSAADKNAVKGSNTQKVGDFYASGMDSASIEKARATNLSAEFAKINAIKTSADVLSVISYLQTIGTDPLFGFYAGQDAKNSAAIVPQLYQGGLGLPDRDYYTEQKYESTRKDYVEHISKMLQLLGNKEPQAAEKAKNIMALETSLAQKSMTRVEQRDPNAIYHKMTFAELDGITPNIKWETLLANMGVKKTDYIIVAQPDFLKEADRLINATPVEDWKAYLTWQLVGNFAGKLSSDFVKENFRFYGTVLNGTKQLKPRWKRVLQDADRSLGEALGQVYVEKNFSADAKRRCLEMVNNLQEVFKARIAGLDWMEQATKDKAIAKLGAFIKKIGYPDKWKDYSKLDINRVSYVRNCINANKFAFNQMIEKIGKPVDKTEWLMTPPTVNAYYEPSMNEIVFPAGILQPPFFDPNADDAVNYGGIGAVIGHEITHGFDDQGRQYDAEGNLKNWWAASDSAKFVSKANRVIDQFDGFKVLDSHVNGKLTLGENLADLGGLSIAYEAFKRTEEGKSNEKIDGFTPDQRFFLGWAQGWRNNIRDQALSQRLVVDPHSPGKFRTNGPLSNMTEFYAAFGVKQGDSMYRDESVRAKVW